VGDYQRRVVEVMVMKENGRPATNRVAVLTVDNDWETLNFVKDNMGDIAANMAGVMQMKSENLPDLEDSAQLFESKLEPFFTLISAMATEHVLDKLSVSLRKALLLMAMDRYSCDSESVCRALGITRVKLEQELQKCGLLPPKQKAA
jgi:DNA-binding NtrC family response regulator